jgi:hypothetical protein
MVSFTNGKISQIRQTWDQGSLLKLIDVIGKTGRNWPIRDGKDQIKLIARSVKSAGKATYEPEKNGNGMDINRARTNSQNATRDPHASLSLFAPREKPQEREPLPATVAPRASSRPPPRDYHDLFVGGEELSSSTRTLGGRDLTESPARADAIASKGGAGKNYAPSRLFDVEDAEVVSPDTKTNPAKFQHFDFADISDPHEKPTGKQHTKETKHGSQWNFDDFNTPAKIIPGKVLRTNDVRHWGNSDDEVAETPIRMKKVDKPRKDAQTHFEFQDDGTPAGPRVIGRPRGAGQNTGLGLYQNNLFDEETGAALSGDAPPPTLANVKDRKKDFDAHFTMTDDSPASKPTAPRISDDRAKAVKMMNANWDTYDQSPNQKENVPTSPITSRPQAAAKGPLSEATNTMSNKGISIAGDGMGGKKNVPVGSDIKKEKGIAIGGDGMGGRVGAGRSWGFGDDSDGEESGGVNKPSKYRTGKTASKSSTSASDFWDF